jgi:hypothetical protein
MDLPPHPHVDPLLDAEYRNQIVEVLHQIATAADESIPENDPRFLDPYRLRPLVERHQMKHLFAVDPKWYASLLTTPKGLEVLERVLGYGCVVDDYDDDVNLKQLMRAYLYIQSIIMGDPEGIDFKTCSLLRLLQAFPRSLYEALRYYLHPYQDDDFAELKASLPSTPFKPRSHNVPPGALRLLFPNIDTTQINPQFDWFIYLLSQFSPVDEKTYARNLSTLLNTTFHPTEFLSLKPGLNLDKIFTHNHLLNSYDEFLHHNPPPIQSLEDQLYYSPPKAANLLFPYFPDQHPLVPSIASKYEFSALLADPTDAFRDYFVYCTCFSLGHLSNPQCLSHALRHSQPLPHFPSAPNSPSINTAHGSSNPPPLPLLHQIRFSTMPPTFTFTAPQSPPQLINFTSDHQTSRPTQSLFLSSPFSSTT